MCESECYVYMVYVVHGGYECTCVYVGPPYVYVCVAHVCSRLKDKGPSRLQGCVHHPPLQVTKAMASNRKVDSSQTKHLPLQVLKGGSWTHSESDSIRRGSTGARRTLMRLLGLAQTHASPKMKEALWELTRVTVGAA